MKIRKILKSTFLIAVTAFLVIGATRAFFSDTETSVGNRFEAGAVDLTIDSTAHYNGMVCVLNTDTVEVLDDYWWQPEDGYVPGPAQYPVAGTACYGSFPWSDLEQEQFFDLGDVKPGDMGENTISMHVYNNDAWACMELKNLAEDENLMTEPEEEVDESLLVGELAGKTYMFGWLEDDGNNVYDPEEIPLFEGPTLASELFDLKVAIADATTGGIPLPGVDDASEASKYIGIQWCVGNMTVEGNNITCDGSAVGNEVQTDKMTFDVSFYVEQARNNEGFRCNSLPTLTPTTEPSATPTPEPSATPTPSPSPTPIACEQDVNLFANGFESDWTGWDEHDTDWFISTTDFQSGVKSAYVVNTDNDERDVRKALSTVGYNNIALSFWYRITGDDFSGSDELMVQWSNDGGSNWTTQTNYDGTNVGNWTLASFNLPAGAANDSGFQIRFRADDLEDQETFRLDNVSVVGDEICEN